MDPRDGARQGAAKAIPAQRLRQVEQPKGIESEGKRKISGRADDIFPREILDHPDAAEERDTDRFGKPQRVIPKNERDADLGNRGRRRLDLVDRELADARRLAGIFLGRLRKPES